ncbi:hypothetical protein O181_042270 [Austropuccinia psidii MF-1]|uniref:MULE transposase domain-containing protein n=1 Tax=Austropuccinia psidii MF-1 TaxID=1389203 RepID=A0A9Q3HI08_9BASI|nr:hypothetical protein [Austropuccinia psidii MF-1]
MTQNKIKIGCDRCETPNPYKNSTKTLTSRKLDCPFRTYARKYSKSTTWTLKVKKPEHSHDATEDSMEHPAFRKFNEEEISKLAQISESLFIKRKVLAQLCIQRESERSVILQGIYSQVKRIKKNKLQGRRVIDALFETYKEETFGWSSARDAEGQIASLFFAHPLPIKLLHGFPHAILMSFTYKTNNCKMPHFHIFGFSSTSNPLSVVFGLMKNETEP